MFGKTAGEWKVENPTLKGNIRDYATIEQLLVIANMESFNAMLIEQGAPQTERLKQLNNMAKSQLRVLENSNNRLLVENRDNKYNYQTKRTYTFYYVSFFVISLFNFLFD